MTKLTITLHLHIILQKCTRELLSHFTKTEVSIKMDHALEITNKDAINRNEKCHPKGSYLQK